jgi:hypothetical protein
LADRRQPLARELQRRNRNTGNDNTVPAHCDLSEIAAKHPFRGELGVFSQKKSPHRGIVRLS